jgi:hypothetical protein
MNQYWSDAISVKSVAKNTKLIRIVRLRDIVRVLYAAGAEALKTKARESGNRIIKPRIATTTTMTTTWGIAEALARHYERGGNIALTCSERHNVSPRHRVRRATNQYQSPM